MVGQCGFHYKEIGMQPMNNDDHEYIGVSENGMYHQMDPNGIKISLDDCFPAIKFHLMLGFHSHV